MKNKTLAILTATIITVAALILTACLSLLHSSATIDIELSEQSDIQLDSTPESEQPDIEITESMQNPDADVPDTDASESTSNNDVSVFEYPEYDYTECDVNIAYIDGSDRGNGVVIDVYSHKTGKLVGQLSFISEEICNYIGELKREEFEPANELWIVKDEACVPLPEGDYRVEVYAGTWFAYTYGNGDMFELTQCTLTFAGGERLNGYIDMLISDLIADIEAGNVAAPSPDTAVSKLLYPGIEGYWDGYYCEELDRYVPAAGRFCERFPYLKND